MKCHIGRTLILRACLCCASQSEREDEPSPHVVCTPVLSPHRKGQKEQHIINKSRALEEDAVREKLVEREPWQEGPGFKVRREKLELLPAERRILHRFVFGREGVAGQGLDFRTLDF